MGHEKHLEKMNQTVTFWLVRKLIVGLLCICSTAATFAQTATVSGVVKDDTGEPVIGAGVLVKGTTLGTITDIDGHFSFRADDLNGVLVVSFVGMETQEIPMKGKGTFDIVLKSSNTLLEEVQVVAYGAQKKVTLTGSISSVNTDELLKVPTASIGNMLSGVLSGVSSIQSSGQPGGDDPDVFIRGISTLNTMNAKPLYLVDGVERSFFQIDPNEVENITILKDASSTAVFGVRGANGVIIVTTKRGKEGKAKINASFSYGIQTPTRMPEFVNSYDYATFLNEAYTNDGKDPKFTPEAVEAFRTHSNPIIYPDTDWMELLFKSSAPQTQGNVNISGGTERVRYFISMGMLDQKGFFKNHDTRYDANFNFNRYNYRANLDIDFTKTTLVAINMGGRVEKRNFPRSGDDINQLFRRIYWATPFSGPGIVDGKWIKGNSQYLPVGLSDGLGNIYGRGYGSKTTNVVNLDLALTQKLDFVTKGLQFKIKVAYNSGYDHTKERATSIESYQPWYRKDVTWMEHPAGSDPNEVVYIQDGEAGLISYAESFGKSRDWYAEASFDWKRDFGLHHLSALALYNQSKTYYPDSDYPGIPRGYVGLVGRVTYDYDNKYLIEGNVGYNGSENFAPGNRYGFFPAVSGGWVLTQEEFLKDNPVVNFLKIRASYGVNGSLPTDYFGYRGLSSLTNGYLEQPGIIQSQLKNDDLQWETNYNLNLGLDFSLWNRLNVTLEYYTRTTKNLLMDRPISMTTGFGSYLMNIGKVSNKGVELEINSTNIRTKDFSWNTTFNISHNKNEIVTLDGMQTEIIKGTQIRKVGKSFRTFYMKEFAGINPETGAPQFYTNDVDENGNYKKEITEVIDEAHAIVLDKHAEPNVIGGLSNTLRYKWFDFNFMFSYQFGGYSYDTWAQKTEHGGNDLEANIPTYYKNSWRKPGDVTKYELFYEKPNVAMNKVTTTRRLHSTDFIRLKTLTFGVTIPKEWTRTIGIENVRLYASANNLWTWAAYDYYDPEAVSGGTAIWGTPPLKTVTFGVNINF